MSADLIARLRDGAKSLQKMMASASFAGDGTHVSVKYPDVLLADLVEAASAVEAAEARIASVRDESVDRAEAVQQFRAWFFQHTGKRIFHTNARVAVDVVLDAALPPPAPKQEGA